MAVFSDLCWEMCKNLRWWDGKEEQSLTEVPGPLPAGPLGGGLRDGGVMSRHGEQGSTDSLPFPFQSPVFAVTQVERSAWLEFNHLFRGHEANCGTYSLFIVEGALPTGRVGGGCPEAPGTWEGSSLVCHHCLHLTVQYFISPITFTVFVQNMCYRLWIEQKPWLPSKGFSYLNATI